MEFSGIAICVATSGRKVDVKWALSLPGIGLPVGMSVMWIAKESSNRAQNREELVEAALSVGAPYIFFLDDDTIVPNFAIRYLHAAIEKDPKTMVCGGIYCTKRLPPEPVVFKKLGGGPFYNWKIGDIFPVDGIGTGCMLIKSEVFKHISKPWFYEPDELPVDKLVELNGREVTLAGNNGTDDLFFCKKVTDAGFNILAHAGVLPVHIDSEGKMYTLPVDSYPCKELE